MQDAALWTVTVCGVDQPDVETTLLALQSAFRVSEEQARLLLDGQERAVKSGLTKAAADKYVAVLQGMGVRCKLSAVEAAVPAASGDGLALVPMEESAAGQAATRPEAGGLSLQPLEEDLLQAQGQMRCPKCKVQQHAAVMCVHCGINVERYRHAPQQHMSAAATNEREVKASFWAAFPSRWAALALAALILLAVYITQQSGGYHPVGDNPHAQAQMHAMAEARRRPATDMQALKALIENGQYAEAEYIIQSLQNMAMDDILWELVYQDTIDGISYKNNFSQASLDRWVESTDSAIAYMARGSFLAMQGNLARGTKFARETSDAQFEQQAEWQTLGVADLQKALEKDRTLLPAYTLLIMCSDSSRIVVPVRKYLEQAISIAPGGYLVRYQYLRTQMPKWGGSYDEMQAFTDTLDAHAINYPMLWLLKGFAPAERAHDAEHDEQYERAIEEYGQALQFGLHTHWLVHRAYCLYRLGEYDKARSDLDLVLQYRHDDYALELKAYLDSL